MCRFTSLLQSSSCSDSTSSFLFCTAVCLQFIFQSISLDKQWRYTYMCFSRLHWACLSSAWNPTTGMSHNGNVQGEDQCMFRGIYNKISLKVEAYLLLKAIRRWVFQYFQGFLFVLLHFCPSCPQSPLSPQWPPCSCASDFAHEYDFFIDSLLPTTKRSCAGGWRQTPENIWMRILCQNCARKAGAAPHTQLMWNEMNGSQECFASDCSPLLETWQQDANLRELTVRKKHAWLTAPGQRGVCVHPSGFQRIKAEKAGWTESKGEKRTPTLQLLSWKLCALIAYYELLTSCGCNGSQSNFTIVF